MPTVVRPPTPGLRPRRCAAMGRPLSNASGLNDWHGCRDCTGGDGSRSVENSSASRGSADRPPPVPSHLSLSNSPPSPELVDQARAREQSDEQHGGDQQACRPSQATARQVVEDAADAGRDVRHRGARCRAHDRGLVRRDQPPSQGALARSRRPAGSDRAAAPSRHGPRRDSGPARTKTAATSAVGHGGEQCGGRCPGVEGATTRARRSRCRQANTRQHGARDNGRRMPTRNDRMLRRRPMPDRRAGQVCRAADAIRPDRAPGGQVSGRRFRPR